ncbi:DUF1508 domain-containing protein [Natronolimnobius sp. AArcel1]|uniref:DUF1508 domain-containing protein n=1 Tax=Natronolimnobius sp. AArcel1 TaxID=1679093 RepID=UPI0013EBFA40|nr:DUF1508 domain-containing protein [Natronolimnobius sp. AArcel1]NGM67472.1 DUF1508 domain-containing protein [Natronolimnobius sp. AArcel1]
MSFTSEINRRLYRLYEHYVGEPDSGKDVYGYWLFILGYAIAAAALITFVIGYAGGVTEETIIRISGTAAATSLAICLFGIGLMLPVRKRGIQASFVGLLVALGGVGWFASVYPHDWRHLGQGLDVEVIVVYTAGVAIIAGVMALVPVLTGQKGMFVEEEGTTDDPPILTGNALEDAQFAVFRDENGDWKWNVLHREALATSDGSAVTRPEAREGIERVKAQISSAGLMELTTSAFRLYEGRDGTWQWTLARDDGSVVGACSGEFAERDGAEESVSFLKDRGPDADVIEIEGAAFTYTEERDRWYWQLVDDDHTVLATSDESHADQAGAEEAARSFAERFEQARVLDIEHLGVELYERDEGWTWRFVDDTDSVVATATATYDARRQAEEAAETLLPDLGSAPVTVAGEPTYERYQSGEEWQWRLIDGAERIVARSPDGHANHAIASEETDKFAEHATDADVVEIDGAEYELYPAGEMSLGDGMTPDDDLPATADTSTATTDGGVTLEHNEDEMEPQTPWQWRLVTEERDIIAASNERHMGTETAKDAIQRMREQAREADLIEFENAAFQVYEADDSEWRWRLIDEDGNVLADSGEEHTSRGEAAEAMMTLKEQAPDAELLEIETAAFELFVNDDDEWGWRLIDEGGKLVAEDPTTHPTRSAARDAMNRLLEHLESDVRTMDDAIFQLSAAEDWHWRFVLPSGQTVAVDDEPHPTRDELTERVPEIKKAAATARGCTIGDVTAQLYENSGWHWRVLDRDREEIADSSVSYDTREDARERVAALTDHAESAPIFTIEDTVVQLEQGGDTEDGWRWNLITADREVVAGSADTEATKDDLYTVVEEVRQLAPMAGRVDFDVASFELVSDEDDRWQWRLLDADGRAVATGTESYESNDRAREALENVRELIDSASILEIDSVSFELHTAEDGWVWQLIDEYGSTMAESTQTYESRTDAREAMNDVKSHAPDGWITFTE